MAGKPGLEQRSIGLEFSLWKWIEDKSRENQRSISGQIRFELTKNKRAEAKK